MPSAQMAGSGSTFEAQMNIEHQTSNTEHRMISRVCACRSMLDVGCLMFDVFSFRE
jgi:hypothetical protein